MKKIKLLFVLVGLLLTSGIFAQSVHPDNLNPPNFSGNREVNADPEVFLQGNYIEIGIHESGSCGTISAPPGGYHGFPYPGLGFVSDFNHDGWSNGTPAQSGDYFLPGDPYEGWWLEFDFGGGEYTFTNAGASGYFDVPQTSLTNTSSGTTNSALWTGTATGGGQSILVEQVFHFQDANAFFLIDVTLTNTGSATVTDLEYVRDVDPDQEVDIGGDFITSNYVASQPNGTNNEALVIAIGPDFNIPLGLGTVHPNAMVSVNPNSALMISDPDQVMDAPYAPTQGVPDVNDIGISCGLRFNQLAPGESVTFTIAYVLNEDDLDNIGEIIAPSVPVSDWAIYFGIFLIGLFVIFRFRRRLA